MANKDNSDKWIAFIIGILGIFIIKSLFENDNSKIVSKKGRKLLSEDDSVDSRFDDKSSVVPK